MWYKGFLDKYVSSFQSLQAHLKGKKELPNALLRRFFNNIGCEVKYATSLKEGSKGEFVKLVFLFHVAIDFKREYKALEGVVNQLQDYEDDKYKIFVDIEDDNGYKVLTLTRGAIDYYNIGSNKPYRFSYVAKKSTNLRKVVFAIHNCSHSGGYIDMRMPRSKSKGVNDLGNVFMHYNKYGEPVAFLDDFFEESDVCDESYENPVLLDVESDEFNKVLQSFIRDEKSKSCIISGSLKDSGHSVRHDLEYICLAYKEDRKA